MEEVYLLCLSYVDNFDVLGVYTDYLKACKEQTNLEKYSVHNEAEQRYCIYCLKLNEYYNYQQFKNAEIK